MLLDFVLLFFNAQCQSLFSSLVSQFSYVRECDRVSYQSATASKQNFVNCCKPLYLAFLRGIRDSQEIGRLLCRGFIGCIGVFHSWIGVSSPEPHQSKHHLNCHLDKPNVVGPFQSGTLQLVMLGNVNLVYIQVLGVF